MVLRGKQFSRRQNRVTCGRLVHSDVWSAQDEPERNQHQWAPANKDPFQQQLAQCTFQSRPLC